ncbi:carbohydrate-binding protein [Aquimarina celericrescens]|uniref:Carbohydrate-binding protein n=1 Tax=Aquimarina celericrescens TaxID=1964542 RepID=A0ABW5AZN9_9FLAO|nr:carbohydrate-binding protein [Aquimarina celericrescens]
MKKIINGMLIVCLCLFSLMGSDISAQTWNLVWQDEFTNGIGPDWVFETGTGNDGWGNQELQYYRRENASVRNGELIITAKRESFGGRNYTSARMKTQGRRSFKYGKIEARIALPSFTGSWPAFWMLGNSISSVGWPSCGEIDIMEHVNNAPDIHGTIHWRDHNGSYASFGKQTNTDVTQFRLYTVEWDENAITWFVDGRQYNKVNIANGINGTSEFHEEFFLLLNMAIGGWFPGFAVDNDAFPAEMRIDWVRVYQKGANPNPSSPVVLYQNCDYGGYQAGLTQGTYTLSQLRSLGVRNDDISSLKVASGYQVTLYRDDNFSGNSIVVGGDDSCLVNENFDDVVTSVIVSQGSGNWSTRIEAENYSNMSGIQREPCSEGGENIGYTDPGDWLAYRNISFPRSGAYTIEYNVASDVDGGQFSTDLNAGNTVLGELNVPNTGGWQNWTTISHTVNVNAGTYPLGIYSRVGGWNLNWIHITEGVNNKQGDLAINKEEIFSVYPNPTKGILHVKGAEEGDTMIIYSVLGKQVLKTSKSKNQINVSSLPKGIYVLKNDTNNKTLKFIKN